MVSDLLSLQRSWQTRRLRTRARDFIVQAAAAVSTVSSLRMATCTSERATTVATCWSDATSRYLAEARDLHWLFSTRSAAVWSLRIFWESLFHHKNSRSCCISFHSCLYCYNLQPIDWKWKKWNKGLRLKWRYHRRTVAGALYNLGSGSWLVPWCKPVAAHSPC